MPNKPDEPVAAGPDSLRIVSGDEAVAIAEAYLRTAAGSPFSACLGLSAQDARDLRPV